MKVFYQSENTNIGPSIDVQFMHNYPIKVIFSKAVMIEGWEIIYDQQHAEV